MSQQKVSERGARVVDPHLVEKLDSHVDSRGLTGDGDKALVGVCRRPGLPGLHDADLGAGGGADLVDLGTGLANDCKKPGVSTES